MPVTLLFKWKGSNLKSRRSEMEKRLKSDGWGTSLDEEHLDKLDYLERKAAREGRDNPLFIRGTTIDEVK